MAYNIQNLKADLQGVLHGTTVNQISGLDNLINRSARQLLLEIDPQETKRTVEFVNPIFNGVYDYPIAADVKGNRLIDIRPQVNRIPRDVWSQAYNQAFDVTKQNIYTMANMFTINFNTGIKTIRIDAPFLNPPTIINTGDNLTSNGTWATTGTASGLSVNNTNYPSGQGSLEFDITIGTGGLNNSTMSAIDISADLNQASLFSWVYVPIGANLTSVELQWGSDNANYYTRTVTVNQQGTAFVNGWNLCQFIWSSATVIGAPVATAIDYVAVNLIVTANMTGCKFNLVESVLGSILEYEYYSKYMFRDASTGAFLETVTDNSNLINLDTETFNLLFNLVAMNAIQQQQGLDATFYDGNYFKENYYNGVARYKALYKSEAQKPQSTYYRTPDTSNRRFLGRRWNS